MLISHVFTVGHRNFVVSSEARHASNDGRGLSSLCGLSCNSAVWESTIGISNLRSGSLAGKIHSCNQGREAQVPVNEDEGRLDTFGNPRIESGEMAEANHDMLRVVENGERCDESAQEGLVAGRCNVENLEGVRWSDARAQDFSYKEMMERWEFLKHLPHKLLRDIGYVIVGPSLLLNSKELPTVSTSMLGGGSNQWPGTKAWLQQLSIPAVEAWFASHRPSQRLGDHFALCIEYVLRHSPHVEAQQLLTSQQVLQRVTEPLQCSKALEALELKLVAPRSSSWCKPSLLTEPGSHDKPHVSLSSPCVVPVQDEQKVLSSESGPTTLDKSTQVLESMDLTKKKEGTQQERMGKRRRKLLKKLERIQLSKGKTTTIGEFDFLFQILSDGGLKLEKEFHHWEVSVKYLLYAGPWEVLGIETPKYATWNNRDTEDTDSPLNRECSDVSASKFEEMQCRENCPREVDNFLGCFLGPHVGETLLDRKARLRNQLALSANPYATLMLRDLYTHEGTNDDAIGTEMVAKEEAGGISKGTEHLIVVSGALLKGYLFYEYKLWCYLESQGLCAPPLLPPVFATSAPNPIRHDDGVSLNSGYPIHGISSENEDEARLNMKHSMGWWTRDIMEFAGLPLHEHSKWYIVPKLEWLSPVVIPQSDTHRCARVLSLSDLVATAAQVADEASRLHMPRKRRFLVAELRWARDWEPCHESVNASIVEELVHVTMGGAWLEVSRGFVVEDTWPVSKLYRPHGYVVSWSPSLQGLHLDISNM